MELNYSNIIHGLFVPRGATAGLLLSACLRPARASRCWAGLVPPGPAAAPASLLASGCYWAGQVPPGPPAAPACKAMAWSWQPLVARGPLGLLPAWLLRCAAASALRDKRTPRTPQNKLTTSVQKYSLDTRWMEAKLIHGSTSHGQLDP